jgi:FtsP/CotA-like multicopper oxidase with cupredoxin domain
VRLSLGGPPFTVIGADGGLRDTAVVTTDALLVPGDRVEIVVGPFDDAGGGADDADQWISVPAVTLSGDHRK